MPEGPKRRVDIAVDACLVWVALLLAYLAVGVLLISRVFRVVARVLRLRSGEF